MSERRRAAWPFLLASGLVVACLCLPWITVIRLNDSGERVNERVVGLAIPADPYLVGRIRKTLLFDQADARASDADAARFAADQRQQEAEAAEGEYNRLVLADPPEPAESDAILLADALEKRIQGGEIARERAGEWKEKERIAAEALAAARGFDVASAPKTPAAAHLLYPFAILSLASFGAGLADRKLAARLGLVASVGLAALFWIGLLHFPEHSRPLMSGAYPMFFAVFLLFAASMATLESLRPALPEDGK